MKKIPPTLLNFGFIKIQGKNCFQGQQYTFFCVQQKIDTTFFKNQFCHIEFKQYFLSIRGVGLQVPVHFITELWVYLISSFFHTQNKGQFCFNSLLMHHVFKTPGFTRAVFCTLHRVICGERLFTILHVFCNDYLIKQVIFVNNRLASKVTLKLSILK